MHRTMKREHGGDDGGMMGRNKRQRPDGFTEALAQGKFELRLLVCSKAAGAVIGKGGENIKRIRSEFEGQISIPDSNTPERVLTIVNSSDRVVSMVQDMLPRLEDSASGDRNPQGEVRLIVHQSHAGALIGRGGSKIKDLREKTNTKIKIYESVCPMSTDRVVLIGGDPQSVVEAVGRIVNELKEIPIKGPIAVYSSANYDPMAAPEYGGFPPQGFQPAPPGRGGPQDMGGRGGRGMRGDGDRGMPPRREYGMSAAGGGGYGGGPPPRGGGYGMGGPGGPAMTMGSMPGRDHRDSMPPQAMGRSDRDRPIRNYGHGGQMMAVPTPSAPLMAAQAMGGPPSMYGGGGPRESYGGSGGGAGGGYGGAGVAAGYGAMPVQSTQVTIPTDLGGTIIGRNGERINKIRDESGASIQLEADTGVGERIITISGTQTQIHAAQYLLQQCVRGAGAPRGGPPEMGGGGGYRSYGHR